ncbi:hypothetical protein [Achromobacter spanius]|uniref:hypothetical protein n=1 Tax=Achromobacter spanius TaxID=217203 RepID=UPI003F693458
MKDIDTAALQVACRNLARGTLWTEYGAKEVAIAQLAGDFLRIAGGHAANVIMAGRDPNLATRAIVYLTYSHVAPIGLDTKRWFHEMLTCLLELAVPSMNQTPESSAFLLDVREGIAESMGPA